jgi:hypothetical protein
MASGFSSRCSGSTTLSGLSWTRTLTSGNDIPYVHWRAARSARLSGLPAQMILHCRKKWPEQAMACVLYVIDLLGWRSLYILQFPAF